jgi:hypothetical protein
VPRLTASVKDGVVGVSVESPLTVGAEDGVLGAVSLADQDGTLVAGQLSPDGPRTRAAVTVYTRRTSYRSRDPTGGGLF